MKNNYIHFSVTNKKVISKFVLEISIIFFLGHHGMEGGVVRLNLAIPD